MIADKNSRRSKGIAYVEFHDESSVIEVSMYVYSSEQRNPIFQLLTEALSFVERLSIVQSALY